VRVQARGHPGLGHSHLPVTSHADKKEDEEEESRQQHLAKAVRLRAAAATLWQPLTV